MTNSLVVGVNGIVGSELFNYLKLNKQSVWGTTRRPNFTDPQLFYLNLADNPETWSIPTIQFDVVYICAGLCRMAICEEDPIFTRLINVDRTVELAKLFSRNNAFIVYLSTNQVFSGNEPFASIQTKHQPINEYGKQKAAAEHGIQLNCEHSAIVRLTKVVEPNMALFQSWVSQLQQNIGIEAFHDMMLAPVTLKQVVQVLEKVGNSKKNGIYHVSGKEDVSYFDLAKYIANQLGLNPNLVTPVSALAKGMKQNFLPRFTTLDYFDTMHFCGTQAQLFNEVIIESIDALKG